jgi:hypothetical protein
MKPLCRADMLRLAPDARNARRRHLVRLLHAAGVRPVLEALIGVDAGHSLDHVLEDFARLSPDVYRAVGANDFPPPVIIEGGRNERPK